MVIEQCHEPENGPVQISDAQEPWQSLKWRYRLQHLKRIRWPEDQEPNKTSRVFNMKATWVCNLPFSKTVQSPTVVIQDMDNQLFEERNDLLVLDDGQDQYSKFVDELLSEFVTTVNDPLPRNKRPLFSYPPVKGPSNGSLLLLSMKSDGNLFSRLYLAC